MESPLTKCSEEWTEKLVQIIDNFRDKTKNIKNIRIKNLLAPLNSRYKYEFCFGNQMIKQNLENFNVFLGTDHASIPQDTAHCTHAEVYILRIEDKTIYVGKGVCSCF